MVARTSLSRRRNRLQRYYRRHGSPPHHRQHNYRLRPSPSRQRSPSPPSPERSPLGPRRSPSPPSPPNRRSPSPLVLHFRSISPPQSPDAPPIRPSSSPTDSSSAVRQRTRSPPSEVGRSLPPSHRSTPESRSEILFRRIRSRYLELRPYRETIQRAARDVEAAYDAFANWSPTRDDRHEVLVRQRELEKSEKEERQVEGLILELSKLPEIEVSTKEDVDIIRAQLDSDELSKKLKISASCDSVGELSDYIRSKGLSIQN